MDYFAYRAASASEDELEFNQDLTVVVGSFANGQRIIRQQLKDLQERFDTDKVVLFFTDRVNFRKDIDPNYKGNRTKRKPAGYLKLKEWCISTWESVVLPGLEADDALGIAATSGEYTNFVLVSPDKDMEQIPCRIYNLKKEFSQTHDKAERKLYEQALTGDSTDGYSGCPGIGPARCGLVLDAVPSGSAVSGTNTKGRGGRRKGGDRPGKDGRSPEGGRGCTGVDWWPRIVAAYRAAGLEEADALRNLRLAKILQHEDWDAANQRPILFTPPCNSAETKPSSSATSS